MEPLLQETLQSRDFSGEDLLKIQAEHCRFVSCIFEDALLEHCRFSEGVFRNHAAPVRADQLHL